MQGWVVKYFVLFVLIEKGQFKLEERKEIYAYKVPTQIGADLPIVLTDLFSKTVVFYNSNLLTVAHLYIINCK